MSTAVDAYLAKIKARLMANLIELQRLLSKRKSQHWLVRIFEVTEEDKHFLRVFRPCFLYYVFGNETHNDVPIWEGYVVFGFGKNLTEVQEIFPRAYLGIQASTLLVERRILFCKKSGDFNEYGIPPEDKSHITEGWFTAVEAARKGSLNEIPTDLLINYFEMFKLMRKGPYKDV